MQKGGTMAEELTIQNPDVVSLVKRLKDRSIGFYDVPDEYKNHPLIVKVERELKVRKSIQKGYDIIRNNFFVEEEISDSRSLMNNIQTTCFNDFSAYYNFLQGDIYKNSCYYGYCFSEEERKKYSLSLKRLNFDAFIRNSIDDFSLDFSIEEQKQYQEIELRKNDILEVLDKINACTTYTELKEQVQKASTNPIAQEFFLSYYIVHNKEKAFNIAMEYINNTHSFLYAEKMCLIYEPQKVLEAYKCTGYTRQTAKKYEKRLRLFVNALVNDTLKSKSASYFDEKTHLFVFSTAVEYELDSKYNHEVKIQRYFKAFEELAEFLENDLSDCDLSHAILPNLDISKYKISDRTKLPIQFQKDLLYTLIKAYDKKEDKFIVEQNWTDKEGFSFKSYHHSFKYFFDFVHFLKGDLRNADLLFCEGLENIQNFSVINLQNANLRSEISDNLGIKHKISPVPSIEIFPLIRQNEEESQNALLFERESYSFEENFECQKIYYISDLHFVHRLNNAHCKSETDIIFEIQKVIDMLLSRLNTFSILNIHKFGKRILLIGGDTSSDFTIFQQFVKMLRKSLDNKQLDLNVVFTLGNHELWAFPQCTLGEIVAKYQKVLSENGMFLLQNNIIYKYSWNDIGEISTDALKSMSAQELHFRLNEARIILFGGIAFSGYNEEFNANLLIYRDTINRQQEIEETKNFEALYRKVCNDLSDKRVIVFTHMPQRDWCSDIKQQKGFVYLNGHTHRNYFYDDGDYRIYADNQIGYKYKNTYLKYFYLDDDYDIFTDYKDGIYEISREQYVKFYRGKNIAITFDREFNKLFMLKKNGYYMFVLQTQNGKLRILNGGAIKCLERKDIDYYFDRMDEIISYIKNPLDEFSTYQTQISEAIKALGGSGTIHGSIVDIDFFNHLYINPIDFTITPYYAVDIVRKIVFSDTQELLKSNCPVLYKNYLKQTENKSPAISCLLNKGKTDSNMQLYLDTDIYKASREIKKMQKLKSNILSIWIEPTIKKLNE